MPGKDSRMCCRDCISVFTSVSMGVVSLQSECKYGGEPSRGFDRGIMQCCGDEKFVMRKHWHLPVVLIPLYACPPIFFPITWRKVHGLIEIELQSIIYNEQNTP